MGSLGINMPPVLRTGYAWIQVFENSPMFDPDQTRCYKKQVKKAALQLADPDEPFAFEYAEHLEDCSCQCAPGALSPGDLAWNYRIGSLVHSP